MSSPYLYFCVFCDQNWSKYTSKDLKNHIIVKHFDSRVDENFTEWIDSLVTYETQLNQCLRWSSPPQLPKSSVENLSQILLKGCHLCDRIIECFKLDLNSRDLKKKSLCVCGYGSESDKVVVHCHQCKQLLHFDCVEPTNFSGEDISLYQCFKCKQKTKIYEISELKLKSKPLRRVHLFHHFRYLPFVCKAVTDGQRVCNKAFLGQNFLRAHIKEDHRVELQEHQLSRYLKHKLIPKVQELIDNSLPLDTQTQASVQNIHIASREPIHKRNHESNVSPKRNVPSNTSRTPLLHDSGAPVLTPVQSLQRESDMNQSSRGRNSRGNMDQMFSQIHNRSKRPVSPKGLNNNSKRANTSQISPPLRSPPVLVNESLVSQRTAAEGSDQQILRSSPVKPRRGPGRPPRKNNNGSQASKKQLSHQSSAGSVQQSSNNMVPKTAIAPNGHIADENPLLRSRLSEKSRLSRPNISLSREAEQALKMSTNTVSDSNVNNDGSDESTGWNSDVEKYERNTHSRRSSGASIHVNTVPSNGSRVNNNNRRQSNSSAGSISSESRRRSQAPLDTSNSMAAKSSANSTRNSPQTVSQPARRPVTTTHITRNDEQMESSTSGPLLSHAMGVGNGGPSGAPVSTKDWLLHLKPKKFPYFPQIGDEVVYLPIGHRLYIETVRKLNLYRQTNTNKYVKSASVYFARVREIKFEKHANIRLARLSLALVENGNESKNYFTVKFHDIDGVIDFIILKQLYETSIMTQWATGQTFRAIVDDKWWFGSIVGRDITDDNVANFFQSFRIEWANNALDNLSNWDLEKVKGSVPQGKNRRASVDITDEERQAFYLSEVKEWPVRGKANECKRVSKALTQIMALTEWKEVAKVFNHMDGEYVGEVAYPIDLDVIKARVDNKFYRRQAAIKYDLKFIESNASLLNADEDSLLVRSARIVTSICLKFIDDKKATDIKDIYDKVMADHSHLNKIKYHSCTRPYLNPNPNTLNPIIENTFNEMMGLASTSAPTEPSVESDREYPVIDMTLTSDEDSVMNGSDDDEEVLIPFVKKERIEDMDVSTTPAQRISSRNTSQNNSVDDTNQVSNDSLQQPAKQNTRKYFCVLCDETFGERNEAIDHYCHKLNIKLKCSHCPQNLAFESLQQYLGHNEEHVFLMRASFDQKRYLTHKSWIDKMVKYIDGLVNELKIQKEIHRLYGDWCPVCKRLNVLTHDSKPFFNDRVFKNNRKLENIRPMEAEMNFKKHIQQHMGYEPIYLCTLCTKPNSALGFRSASLESCRQHLIQDHKKDPNIDNPNVMSYLSNTKIPDLEKAIPTLVNKFIINCLNY